jgi:anaerobic dimethyl sulfoxide reductase subunit C
VGSGEWPLAAFTLLAQTAVGMTLVLAVLAALGHPGATDVPGGPGAGTTAPRAFRRALVVALAAMGTALVVSFLHLGDPGRAFFAARHWRASWLSREVVLAVAFLGLVAAAAVVTCRAQARPRTLAFVLVPAALAGVLLVAAMAGVYMLPTVPAWSGPRTPLAFAVSTVLLGSAAVLAVAGRALDADHDRARSGRRSRILLGAAVAALAVKLLAALLLAPETTAEPVAFPGLPPSARLAALAWGAAAAGLLALLLSLRARKAGRWRAALAWIALVGFVFAESIDRLSFYAAYYRIGV